MESLEQEFMIMLRRLPIPVTITWRSGHYHWQCAQGTGKSPHLVTAVEEAFRFLLSDLTAQVGRQGNKKDPADPDAGL